MLPTRTSGRRTGGHASAGRFVPTRAF
jgi:hypothetical protein